MQVQRSWRWIRNVALRLVAVKVKKDTCQPHDFCCPWGNYKTISWEGSKASLDIKFWKSQPSFLPSLGVWGLHEQREEVGAKIQICHCHLYVPQAHVSLRETSHCPGFLTSPFGVGILVPNFTFLLKIVGVELSFGNGEKKGLARSLCVGMWVFMILKSGLTSEINKARKVSMRILDQN